MTLADVSGPEVRAVLEPLLARGGRGEPVVFDADGTLWRGDVGEELLRALAARGVLPRSADGQGAFAEYERRLERDPVDAYGFNARVLAGLSVSKLERDCEVLVRERFQGRLFRFSRPWLTALTAAGYSVWICSASPIWIVRAGAALLGVPAERCIGATCVEDDGVVTARLETPLPAGEGKVLALKARGLAPVLAVGNGELDLPMLEAAARAIVVAPYDEPGNGLVQQARQRGWPVQRG